MNKTCPSRLQTDKSKQAAATTFNPQVIQSAPAAIKKNKLAQINLNLNDLDDEILAGPFKRFKDQPVSNSISRNESKKSEIMSKSNSFQNFKTSGMP